MTTENLTQRAAVCEHFRPCGGMLAAHEAHGVVQLVNMWDDRVLVLPVEGDTREARPVFVNPTDLDYFWEDPATLGWLRTLVFRAWKASYVGLTLSENGTDDVLVAIYRNGQLHRIFVGKTEAEAFFSALEAVGLS